MSFPFASELAEGAGRNRIAKEQLGHVLNLAFHPSPPLTWYGVFYSWESWISSLPGRSVHFMSEIHLRYNPFQHGQTHIHHVPCLQDFQKTWAKQPFPLRTYGGKMLALPPAN